MTNSVKLTVMSYRLDGHEPTVCFDALLLVVDRLYLCMSRPSQILSITTEDHYERAISRYEKVKKAPVGSDEHAKKMQLANVISAYENEQWDLPELDQAESMKIWTEDLSNISAIKI